MTIVSESRSVVHTLWQSHHDNHLSHYGGQNAHNKSIQEMSSGRLETEGFKCFVHVQTTHTQPFFRHHRGHTGP